MIYHKIQQTKRNSYLLTIPKSYCDLLGIEKGTVVGIEYKQNKIVIAPASPARQTGAANTAKEVSA